MWLDEIGSSMANSSETTNNKRKLDGTQDIQYRFEEVADSAVNDVVIIKEEKVTREEIYGRVPEFHKAPLKPVIADPIFKNPCSFESLIEIFRVVVEKNKKRKWLVLISDGVPFVLGWKVILWSYICNECGASTFLEVGW